MNEAPSAPLQLVYQADTAALGGYADRFRALPEDAATQAWLAQAAAKPHGHFRTWLVDWLARFVSVYDAHGLTGSYPMHLLTTEQWRSLVGQGRRLLDVGAGAGYVTEQARPLFEEVVCTETSRPLARRLRQRGFRVHVGDLLEAALADEPAFDVIACLNVLDRTRRPLSLLRRLGAMLTTDARLLIALPLPVRAHTYVASACVSPDEVLPSSEPGFEAAVVELTRDLFEAEGFRIERIARAPYLSLGDVHAPIYTLDDALWVLRRA